VRRWESIEDPEWVEVVIDLTMSGESEAVLVFWDKISEYLGDIVESRLTDTTKLLSVDVHWL